KMPAFEWVHVQLHQQKGMISLSPPTICNSAEQWAQAGRLIASGVPRQKVAIIYDVGVSTLYKKFPVGDK
ncbi:helix-turn-helix domain-containing protein, partial [Escherichia coli]|uniref:helix-turn-helix domain-containing protein n=1 Tax=Escherichia coli TaxID=562 RepID=UPI001CFAA8DE